jgi:alpha-tubulin suppressor-like RCC1 family protein
MNPARSWLLKAFLLLSLLLLLMPVEQALCAEPPAGKVVWWGKDVVQHGTYSERTNGVIESDGEVLANVVAIAARQSQGLALKSDGTVIAFGLNMFGGNGVPAGLSNVVSISAEGNSCWAIRLDGTVARWGDSDEDDPKIVAAVRNVTAITWAGYRGYLALKKDGTVLGFRFGNYGLTNGSATEPAVRPVRVRGQVLSNVVALASSYEPLVLKNDGTVWRLRYQPTGVPTPVPEVTKVENGTFMIDLGGEFWKTPYDYTSAEPVRIGGQALTNVIAIADGGGQALALKNDGTVVAWGTNYPDETAMPGGLSNVTAIAADEHLCLALKSDGTVVAWGGKYFGQTSVPAGLSNVVAIAAGGWLSLALTTDAVPPSVYIYPHGRLEEMERKADLVFKGRALSTRAITNTTFPPWGKPHATQLEVISVLKGSVQTNVLVFQHNTSGPDAWGGGTPPPHYAFEAGQSYLIFAEKTGNLNVFRQLSPMLRSETDGVTRTLDSRPLPGFTVKEAHWLELSRLLTSEALINVLYAIQHLNVLSKSCLDPWGHTGDFKREAVLHAMLPLVTNANDKVAVAAIGCFQLGGNTGTSVPDQGGWAPILRGCSEVRPENVAQVAPYAATLAAVAGTSSSISRRAAAIAAFSCTGFPVVRNSLPQWLRDPADVVRAQAVLLLPDFPGDFSESALRACAADPSPRVREAVADAIGNGKIKALLPTLEGLFSAPLGPTNPIPPLTLEELQAGGRLFDESVGDVHTSAGHALLEFETDQVSTFLKAHLTDAGFRVSFLCKLAEKGAGPWLKDLAAVMEERRTRNQKKAEASGVEQQASYFESLMYLSGKYYECWNILHSHLRDLPKQGFEAGKMDRYLDVLENAGRTGSREPVMIYELYRMKGLDDRARKFRSQTESKLAVYNIRQFYDKVDATQTNSAPKGDR